MKKTKAKADQERKLVAELAHLEKRKEYLSTRFDEITLECRDVEEKLRLIRNQRQLVLSKLDDLGVRI